MIRFYSLLSLMRVFECGIAGGVENSSSTVVLRKHKAIPATEARHRGRLLSQTSPPRKHPFPRPPVKKRRV